ncbi:hypothetical protein E8E14_002465 [Neopestalotiopsis sp. 37M]|nr:hypothetical protein E8E14_002465 [Neopestalotiopsis sp. 37M]
MENPLQLQYCPAGDTGNDTPLILIHDGGGTIFPYFRLGSLNRDVWAIHDPHFSTSDLWKGGIDEMAEHYMNSIKTAGIRGSVILGGWSLGGYISLAMAKILAGVSSPAFCVTGLLLIDTPFHIPLSKLPPAGPDPEFNDLPDAVRTSFKNCDLLLDTWKLPDWETSACKGRTVRVTVRDKPFNVPDGSVLQKSLGEDWRIVEMRSYTDATPAHLSHVISTDFAMNPFCGGTAATRTS